MPLPYGTSRLPDANGSDCVGLVCVPSALAGALGVTIGCAREG